MPISLLPQVQGDGGRLRHPRGRRRSSGPEKAPIASPCWARCWRWSRATVSSWLAVDMAAQDALDVGVPDVQSLHPLLRAKTAQRVHEAGADRVGRVVHQHHGRPVLPRGQPFGQPVGPRVAQQAGVSGRSPGYPARRCGPACPQWCIRRTGLPAGSQGCPAQSARRPARSSWLPGTAHQGSSSLEQGCLGQHLVLAGQGTVDQVAGDRDEAGSAHQGVGVRRPAPRESRVIDLADDLPFDRYMKSLIWAISIPATPVRAVPLACYLKTMIR